MWKTGGAFWVFLLVAGSGWVQGAISIDGYDTLDNDRFSNDASFVLDGYDLSGVGLTDGGRWATMVSPNVFISANHYPPALNDGITFYAGNDPAGSSVDRTIAGLQQIGNTDLQMGYLNKALPAGYAFYDFATGDITGGGPGLGSSPYKGENAYLFGRSPGSFSVSQDMAVGRNKLDYWFGTVTDGSQTTDSIGAVVNQSGDTDLVTYEAKLITGDSGGPLMVDDGSGGLTLVGINWFVAANASITGLGNRDINGFSYIGNYDGDVQAYIDANPVPEPAVGALLAGLGALGLLWRRRRT